MSVAIISLEEFIEGALDDDWIREMLECDPSTVNMERPRRRDTVLGTHGWPEVGYSTHWEQGNKLVDVQNEISWNGIHCDELYQSLLSNFKVDAEEHRRI